VVLIRAKAEDNSAIGTFDYADLNSYLLLVVGLQQPPEYLAAAFQEIAKKARAGEKIPLKDVKALGSREPLTALPTSTNLMKAVEVFGSGVHRIVVLEEAGDQVVGVFSQSRLVKFLWENGNSFPKIDELYPQCLKDLSIGSHQVISIK
jgi:CBS domain-containing protein